MFILHKMIKYKVNYFLIISVQTKTIISKILFHLFTYFYVKKKHAK